MLHRTATRRGFTLVELLVVLAIIGVLVALLLPAVQAAREAARNTQCKSHLRQIAVAVLNHETAHGKMPAGGWGQGWIGDPAHGIGPRQPGGWIFQAAAYLEEASLASLNPGLSGDALRSSLAGLAVAPVATFHCPSRRTAKLYPAMELAPKNFEVVKAVAKTDYAANAGSRVSVETGYHGPFPMFGLPSSDCLLGFPECGWATSSTWLDEHWDGVVGERAGARLAQLTDGASHTLLAGEKWLYELYYEVVSVDDPQDNQHNKISADNPGDNGPIYVGYDYDNVRACDAWTDASGYRRGSLPRSDSEFDPFNTQQDKKGAHYVDSFGGPHPGGVNIARCDGSVSSVTFDVEPDVWRRLGSRDDGEQ